LEQVNGELSKVNRALGAVNNEQAINNNPSLAKISIEQQEKIKSALFEKTNNESQDQAIYEASQNIYNFIRINSCIKNYSGSLLNTYAAPGKEFPSHNYIGSPLPTMKYHDKSTCATVLRIQGWKMPAKNALQFEVVYISDSSGESNKRNHELIKQSSGQWLFSK
jgi:hypothetical protein